MFAIKKVTKNHVVDFAAEELKKYLRMMMPWDGEGSIQEYSHEGVGFQLGLMSDFGLSTNEAENTELDDIIHIDTDENGGIIAGSNACSVLLAVYCYLRKNGCRFLFPGREGELIPVQKVKPVFYHKMADNRYRGQCNEGAEYQQCMIDAIDFTPKIGLNTFMIEFRNPYTYYNSYYSHAKNPAREPEPVTAETVIQWKRECEAEIAKRGLRLWDMGHGWTSEPFKVSSIEGWTPVTDEEIPDDTRQYLALINGKRGLYNGVALNTNICMSNKKARKIIVDSVVSYAKKARNVATLCVDLADWQHNHCECRECKKKTPSDWYVILLNEIDKALTENGLNTKIGTTIYSDLAWEPENEIITNPSRFVSKLCAISRSYLYSVEPYPEVEPTPYVRNVSERFDTLEEYVMRAHRWQKMGAGNVMVYEYHFWKEQFYAPGVISYARRVYEDIRAYKANGFLGIVEDCSQRSFFPNGLSFYVYGMSLFDQSLTFEEIADDYLRHAYGESAAVVRKYLENIDRCLPHKYLETRHSKPVVPEHYHDKTLIPLLEEVGEICKGTADELKDYRNMPYRVQTVSVRLLDFHMKFCLGLADAFKKKASGEDEEAARDYREFINNFGKYEKEIEGYYDHFIVHSAFDHIFTVKRTLEQ